MRRRTATGVQALAHPLPSFLSSSVKWAQYHLPAASRGCGEMSEKDDVSPGASGEGGRSWDQLELELGEASPCGSELGFTPRAQDALEGLSKRVTCSGCRPEEVHSGAGLGLTRGAELQVGESAWWGGVGVPQILRVTRAEWGPEDVPGKPFLFWGREL